MSQSEALEGRQWWLALQRQRSAQKARRPTAAAMNPVDSPPDCSTGNADGERAHHRTALLCNSGALLRRMTRRQAGSIGGGASPEASAAVAALSAEGADQPGCPAQQRPVLTAVLRRVSDGGASPEMSVVAQAANQPGSPAQQRPTLSCQSSRCSSLVGVCSMGRANSADLQTMNGLLEGGLVGRAMAASAQWRATQQQLAAREQQEWRLLRGESFGASCNASATSTACCELPPANSSVVLSQLLPALAEGPEEGEDAGEGAGQEGGGGASFAAQHAQQQQQRDLDYAALEALISSCGDAEVREYLQQSFAALDAPDRSRSSASGAGSAPEASASSAAAVAGAEPSALPCASSPADPFSTAATTGGDVSAATGYPPDPVLAAWMVTRAPPDLPVRGYTPPPARSACRLIAAKEMREYYRQQKRRQGGFFKFLGLTRVQAGGRGSDVAPMQLPTVPTAQPQRKTLRGAVRKSIVLKQMAGMAEQSKVTVWARERADQVEAGAVEQLRQQREEAAATRPARVAATAAAARRLQAGAQAGNAFASIVQQAKQQQEQAAEGSSQPEGRRLSSLPALNLQKLTQRWQRQTAATTSAAGQQTPRQRRASAARLLLREQWDSVRQRLLPPEAASE